MESFLSKGKFMEIVQGVATNIRHSTSVSGTQEQTSTSHVAVLEVSSRPVELTLSESIFINNGDEVIIAGQSKRGLLRGMAYYNKTKGVKGKRPAGVYWLLGILFCAVFLPIGIYLLKTAMQYEAAFKAVDQ
jgi:hypothetical protein